MSAMQNLDRRQLLVGGLSLAGGALLSSPSARAATRALGREGTTGRNLVLIQLSGGNDGLSTVIPFGDDAYHRARSASRHKEASVRKLDDYRGLHPELAHFHELFDDGQLAIVEGVGYPDAVRSHFKSLEIWHTGDAAGRVSGDGWIGKLCESAFADAGPAELVVHLGRYAPYSVHSRRRPPVSLESPTSYAWFGEPSEARTYADAGMKLEARKDDRPANGRDRALSHLRGLLDDARASSARIRRAAAAYETPVDYPREAFAARLKDIAALIERDLGTRVFSTTIGGFDTHQNQKDTHDRLMGTVDKAVGAFVRDLSRSAAGRDTVIVLFSEFGRRVKENGSKGTDHGQAGPMFVIGTQVRGGLYGEHPSLEELSRGDLSFTTDFRSVYASVIDGWFGADHRAVLGREYPRIDLFRA